MIIFLSDLHFGDGTAGEHNLSGEAFKVFFGRLQGLVERRLARPRKPGELKIVLLGDIFDVLRSSHWLSAVPEDERPWGDPAKAEQLHEHVEGRLTEVLRKNSAAFDAFAKGARDLDASVVYVPGNHDRLLNATGRLRGMVRKALGVTTAPGEEEVRFDNVFEDPEHGVYAVHGHECDVYNFESPGSTDPAAYDSIPIGDPITTELVSRLPELVCEHAEPVLRDKPQELQRLERNIQQVEDVRPLRAALEWVLWAVPRERRLEDAVEAAVDQAIRDFRALPFVRAWYAKHDRPLRWDEADALQAVLWAAEKLDVVRSRRLVGAAETLASRFGKDADVEAAGKLFADLPAEYRYVVMGHTHAPRQVPMNADAAGSARVYLNTGTWRPTHHRCRAGGFARWKEMSYALVYRGGDRPGCSAPTFETWSGTLGG